MMRLRIGYAAQLASVNAKRLVCHANCVRRSKGARISTSMTPSCRNVATRWQATPGPLPPNSPDSSTRSAAPSATGLATTGPRRRTAHGRAASSGSTPCAIRASWLAARSSRNSITLRTIETRPRRRATKRRRRCSFATATCSASNCAGSATSPARDVRELLGHTDASTTMIHTHVLNRGGRDVASPLDRPP